MRTLIGLLGVFFVAGCASSSRYDSFVCGPPALLHGAVCECPISGNPREEPIVAGSLARALDELADWSCCATICAGDRLGQIYGIAIVCGGRTDDRDAGRAVIHRPAGGGQRTGS